MENLRKEMKKEAIYDLQNMLYFISRFQKGIPSILPDGIFEEKTTRAVKEFQRENQIAQTGIADYETWSAVEKIYSEIKNKNKKSKRLNPNLNTDKEFIDKNEYHESVYIAQILFNKMAEEYSNFCSCDVCGILDNKTSENLKNFQGVCKIDVTGIIDRKTWEKIAAYYNMYFK